MTWSRERYSPSNQQIFAYFVVFGDFSDEVSISASKYNFTELPANTDIVKYHDGAGAEFRDQYKTGYLWDRLCQEIPELADAIDNSPACMVIQTEIEDQLTLDYLRNLIGLVTYFLDDGGVCVFEPLNFKWWSKDEWSKKIFQPKEPKIYRHVQILSSDQDDDNSWLHTRGMRLFGRPDISIHDVPEKHFDIVCEMINRFIELQALGGIVEDGQSINMEGLPEGMWCENKGDLDDPDFNNVHLEIHWG